MNIHYIAGFFDADGYITIHKNTKNQEAAPTVGFTNTVLSILEEIQKFIYQQTGIKGSISLKKAKRENHNNSYDLKYFGFNKCLILKDLIPCIHPKKLGRFNMLESIHNCTPRNGKYNSELLNKRRELCEKFLNIV